MVDIGLATTSEMTDVMKTNGDYVRIAEMNDRRIDLDCACYGDPYDHVPESGLEIDLDNGSLVFGLWMNGVFWRAAETFHNRLQISTFSWRPDSESRRSLVGFLGLVGYCDLTCKLFQGRLSC